MSDQRQVLVNAEDLEKLIQAATTLSAAAVSLASSASAQRADSEIGSFVRICEELEPEGLENRRSVWESQFNRLAEDGLPEVPEQLLEFGRYCLPVSTFTAHSRVFEAFRAGFWARVALDCVVPYHRIEQAPRVPAHWIVLRVGGHKAPARFENQTSFEQYVRGASDNVLIYEAFQNIAEVHIFCHAARIFLPQCLVWRSNH